MTALLYMHPEGFPSLVSDCLLTFKGSNPSKTPSQIFRISDIDDSGNWELGSKYFRFKENGLLAASGGVRAAQDFLERLESNFDIQFDEISNRPGKVVTQLLNEHNYGRPTAEKISLTGFFIASLPEVGWQANAAWLLSERFNTKNFNECATTGSGSAELRQIVKDFDHFLPDLRQPPFEKAKCLIGGLNGAKLYFEPDSPRKDSWGGYHQWTFFDTENWCWSPGPCWAHLGFMVDDTEGGKVSGFSRFFLYSSNLMRSHLGLLVREEDAHRSVTWPIDTLFPRSWWSEPGDFTWTGFKPDCVTVSICHRTSACQRLVHRTLNPAEMRRVEFLIHEAAFTFDLGQETEQILLSEVRR